MFGRSSSSSNPSDSTPSTSAPPKSSTPRETVVSFVKEVPSAMYTFDSDDKTQRSELCRKTQTGTSCIKVESTAKVLFETMQNLGFFCALPVDPTRTHMECRPIPK